MKISVPHRQPHDDQPGGRLIKRLSLALCFCAVFAIAGWAQTDKPASSKMEDAVPKSAPRSSGGIGSTPVLAAMDEDYRIGANDVLEIEIEDAPELSGARRVNANGTFLMPYLGRLAAKGKTPEELAQVIVKGLDQRYLFNPRVNVVVKQYNSRSFFIQGSVRNPGVYQIEGRPTLLELLTVAGGLADSHASTAFIIRKIKPAEVDATVSNEAASPATKDLPQYNLIKANLMGLLRGIFTQNMFLEPGDIVNIPQTEMFFVAGEVHSPGSFALKEGTSLRQAIALAQGTNFKAALNRTIIFRDNPETGKRQEIRIDLAAVMSGKAEDQPIMANDIVIVANSKMKSIAAPLLSTLGMQAVRLPVF